MLAFEVAEIAAWDVNLATNRSVWSSKLFDMLRLDRNQAASSTVFFEHVHPDDLDRVRASYAANIKNRTLFNEEFRIRGRDGETRYLVGVGRVTEELDGKPVRMMGVNFDISDRKRHEEHTHMLLREVNHRSKNMLSLILAIAKQTVATRPEDFLARFGQRVQALAANQDLLIARDWKAVPFQDLVRSQLALFGEARVLLAGPPVEVTASAAQTLSMALHELATNAAKYGALSGDAGRIELSWDVHTHETGVLRFAVSWVESGGPRVHEPDRRGFGSTVIEKIVKASLGSDAELQFLSTGVVWRIDCAADQVLSGTPRAPQLPNSRPASGRPRVLVVEDEPLIAMEVAEACRNCHLIGFIRESVGDRCIRDV